MRIPSFRQPRGLDAKMTPMIDVIFLLLVFFVCTASFHAVEQILPTTLSLPGSVDSETPLDPQMLDLDEVVISLGWDAGHPLWKMENRRFASLAEVEATLAALAQVKADLPVILDPDGAVPMEHVIDLYDACRQAGLETIRFAAEESGRP